MKKRITYSLNFILFLLIFSPSFSHSSEKDHDYGKSGTNLFMESHNRQNAGRRPYIVKGSIDQGI